MTAGPTILATSGIAASALGVANAVAGSDYSPLYNLGAIGVVLAWLMWRVEPRMKSMERSIDRAVRAHMLMLIAIPELAEAVKKQAKEINDEIDEAEKEREGK